MYRDRAAFDTVSMVRATSIAKNIAESWVERGYNIEHDTEKESRIKSAMCKACYYSGSSIAGAAMTVRPCACCGEDQTYGSTHTNSLCLDCAKKHNLCKECGGDSEMRERRRKWPTAE